MFSASETRKAVRYCLHLPVTVRLGATHVFARSENISPTGILLVSDLSMREGSFVELTVHLSRSRKAGASLRARGKVLRVGQKSANGFAIAIACDSRFRITPRNGNSIPHQV